MSDNPCSTLPKCEWCFKYFASEERLRAHNQIHKCTVCFEFFPSEILRWEHAMSHYVFKCDCCPMKYTCKEELQQHVNAKHTDRSKTKCINRVKPYSRLPGCDWCCTTFFNKESLRDHNQIIHDCILCKEKLPCEILRWEHILLHYIFKCNCCPMKYANKEDLQWHIKVKHKDEEDLSQSMKVNCTEDLQHPIKVKDKEDFRQHVKIEPMDEVVKIEPMDEVFKIEPMDEDVWMNSEKPCLKLPECDWCHWDFPSEEKLQEHNRMNHNCKFCEETFPSKDLRWQHISLHYAFRCNLCPMRYINEETLQRHMKTMHAEKSVGMNMDYSADQEVIHKMNCDDSLKFSEDYSHLSEALCETTPDQSRKFKCQICGTSFDLGIDLLMHLGKIQEPQKSYMCPVCNKSFPYDCKLRKHMITHFDATPNPSGAVKCQICGKSFDQGVGLKMHMLKIHRPQKSYLCPVCDKSFPFDCKLKKHMILHSDKTPNQSREFKCEICGKSFDQEFGLNTHLRIIHKPQKSYVCSVCNKSFPFDCKLKKHMIVHSDEFAHVCKVCNKGFHKTKSFVNHKHTDKSRKGKPSKHEVRPKKKTRQPPVGLIGVTDISVNVPYVEGSEKEHCRIGHIGSANRVDIKVNSKVNEYNCSPISKSIIKEENEIVDENFDETCVELERPSDFTVKEEHLIVNEESYVEEPMKRVEVQFENNVKKEVDELGKSSHVENSDPALKYDNDLIMVDEMVADEVYENDVDPLG